MSPKRAAAAVTSALQLCPGCCLTVVTQIELLLAHVLVLLRQIKMSSVKKAYDSLHVYQCFLDGDLDIHVNIWGGGMFKSELLTTCVLSCVCSHALCVVCCTNEILLALLETVCSKWRSTSKGKYSLHHRHKMQPAL